MVSDGNARALPRPSADGLAGQIVAGLLVAGIAVVLTYAVTHLRGTVAIAALVVAAGTVWFATTRHTGMALALLMLYLGLLDGYLKLSSGSSAVTFVRDALLFAMAAGLLVRAIAKRQPLPLPPLSGWVLLFVVIVLAQVANPHGGTLTHSLAGVRQHLEFVPLFFLTYAFVRTTRALRVFAMILLVIAAANAAANFVQFHLTPAQLAAWGPGYAERINGQGNFEFAGRTFNDTLGTTHTRPFGLMSDAGSGGLVGAYAVGAILACATLFRRLRYLLLSIAMAILVAIGVITSEGRGAVIAAVIVGFGFLLLTGSARGRVRTLFGGAVVAVVAVFVVQQIASSSGSLAFRYQGLTTAGIFSTTQQARGGSFAKIVPNVINHPLGAGLGIGGPASGLSGAPQFDGVADTETEISFATLETGIPGMVTLIGFTIMIFALGLRRLAREPDPEARIMLAAIIAPILGLLALYMITASSPTTPGGPYLWACGGIVAYWLVTRQRELGLA